MSMKYQELSIKVLRYFNPIGSHSSLILGESPKGKPNNLMPYIIAVAFGKYKNLKIFGSDFDTDDGTGVRDYIHINDLVVAHKKALNYKKNGIYFFNIGTGKGFSVLELLNSFQIVNNIEIPFKFVNRRSGEFASVFSNSKYAEDKLKWKAQKIWNDMCRDTYLLA